MVKVGKKYIYEMDIGSFHRKGECIILDVTKIDDTEDKYKVTLKDTRCNVTFGIDMDEIEFHPISK